MAASPKFKVFDKHGEYLASCKRPEEAAVLMAFLGEGATIRDGHMVKDVVWREGAEEQSAAVSYDYVAEIVEERVARKLHEIGVVVR